MLPQRLAAFLAEVARELDLSGVHVHAERMEDVDDRSLGFDFVTARAVAIDEGAGIDGGGGDFLLQA